MSDLTDTNLLETVRALRSGEISSRELTSAYIDRIDRLEPEVQAFISLTPSQALAQADQADARLLEWRRSDQDLGAVPPLLGVPIAVKDVLTVAGTRTTAGSKTLDTFFPPYNATCVGRLLDAGMVILGKTNTDEFAMGSSTENSAYKITRNPWDLSRVRPWWLQRGQRSSCGRADGSHRSGNRHWRQCAPAGFLLRGDRS